jgi:hypothetical protein
MLELPVRSTILASVLVVSFASRSLSSAVEPRGLIRAVDPRVKWVGRTLVHNESVIFDWPGTSAQLRWRAGTYLDVWIRDSTPTGTNFAVFAVSIICLGRRPGSSC